MAARRVDRQPGRRRDRRHGRDPRRRHRQGLPRSAPGMKTSPGIAAKMFRTLADEGVNIEMISTSTIRIRWSPPPADMERAARALHTAFGLDSGQALLRAAAGADSDRRQRLGSSRRPQIRSQAHVALRRRVATAEVTEQQRSPTTSCARPAGCSTTRPASELTPRRVRRDRRRRGRRVPDGVRARRRGRCGADVMSSRSAAGIGRMTAALHPRSSAGWSPATSTPAFLERCRETVARFGDVDRLRTVHVADGRTLDIGDGSADVVFSYITLQHCRATTTRWRWSARPCGSSSRAARSRSTSAPGPRPTSCCGPPARWCAPCGGAQARARRRQAPLVDPARLAGQPRWPGPR